MQRLVAYGKTFRHARISTIDSWRDPNILLHSTALNQHSRHNRSIPTQSLPISRLRPFRRPEYGMDHVIGRVSLLDRVTDHRPLRPVETVSQPSLFQILLTFGSVFVCRHTDIRLSLTAMSIKVLLEKRDAPATAGTGTTAFAQLTGNSRLMNARVVHHLAV